MKELAVRGKACFHRSFFIVFLSCLVIFSPSSASASDDLQYWSSYNFTKKIGPGSRIIYEPELRLRSDASDLYHHEHRVGVQQKLTDIYTLGVHYVTVRTQKLSGIWQAENRGELDLVGRWNWQTLRVSLRGRAELRYVENDGKDELWRFRIRPHMAYPMKCGKIDVTPFISDDVFYDADAGAWNQNRFYAGVTFPIKKEGALAVNLDVYYMLENKRSAAGDWSANHVIGTKVFFLF